MIHKILGLLLLGLLLAAPVWALGEVTPPPLSEEEYIEQALDEFLAGEYNRAVETLTRMVASFPENAAAYLYRAYAYQGLGRYTLALDDFTRAIGLEPWQWGFFLARGDAFSSLNQLDNALSDYQAAIDLNPRFGEAFGRIAEVYRLLGNRERARSYGLVAQAILLNQAGDRGGALQLLNQALEQSQADDILRAYTYYNRSLIHFHLGHLDDASRDVTRAMTFYPDMHDLYLVRGIVHRLTGNLQGAGQDFQRRIELLRDPAHESQTLANGGISMMSYGVVDTLALSCAVGESATIRAVDIDASGVDPLIAVLDPHDMPIAGDDDFGLGVFALDALVERLPITQPGPHTVLVSHANGGYVGRVQVSYQCE